MPPARSGMVPDCELNWNVGYYLPAALVRRRK